MHELGYCEALLPVLDRRAAGRTVTAVGIIAGVRHKLVADVMQMAWQLAADATPYADAITVIDEVEMQATCGSCDHQFTTADTLAACPECAAVGALLAGGDEFALGWVQFADSPGPDTTTAAVAGPSATDHHHQER